MAEVITRRHTVTCTERVHGYHWVEDPGARFGFDVDEDGAIIRTEGNAHNVDMLATWLTEGKLVDDGIEVREWSYTQHAVLRCDCREEVVLSHFTNTCECGRDYNSFGQLLAPRSQWGEETGESLGDILRIP